MHLQIYNKLIALVFTLALIMLGGCSHSITSQVLMPAEINLSHYETVAVVDFEGADEQWGRKIALWLEEELSQVRFDEKPYFKIVTRNRLKQILEEHKLQMSGLVSQDNSKRLGELLGVDAIITGIVNTANVDDHISYKTFTERQKNKDGEKEKVKVKRRCVERVALADFTVQFISVETGVVEISRTFQQKKKKRACGDKRIAKLPGHDEFFIKCARLAVQDFVNKVTPHYSTVKFALKNKDDSIGGSSQQVTNLLKTGTELANNGDWEGAERQFGKAVELKADSPAANYNLATILEIRGELQLAASYYRKASEIKPTKDYINAVSHISERIATQTKLQDQLRENP